MIVIPDDEPAVLSVSSAYSRLSGHEIRLYTSRPSDSEELVGRLQHADAVINIRSTTRFTDAVLRRCPRLRLISVWGTGLDHVDLAAAKTLDIRVTNTPGVSATAVAEHTVALIMALARGLLQIDREVREGSWPRGMGRQLYGKTLGLVGTGAIGREVARIAKGIGMRVIGWTFHPAGDAAEWVSLEEIFRQADVVSVHLRQSSQTVGMIRREHFQLMKPHAIFINTARGPIICESDLVEALQARRIAGAGLDVFEKEPLPPDSPLLKMNNVILTPHAAGITPEATEAGLDMAIRTALAFLAENGPGSVKISRQV